MPPADEEQPSAEDRRSAILELEAKLVAQAVAASDRKPAMLRRLNRVEYRNTVGDLLHLEFGSFDPARDFPDDTRVQGFASVGEKLVTSSFLMRAILGIGRRADRAGGPFRAPARGAAAGIFAAVRPDDRGFHHRRSRLLPGGAARTAALSVAV